MRRLLVLVLAAACGCGGGGSAARSASAPAPSTPAATRAAGGLVGTIDRARLLSVCENARQADTVLQTGVGVSQVDAFLTADAQLLERPPVDPAAHALAGVLHRDLLAGRRQQAVAAVTAFCRARGG